MSAEEKDEVTVETSAEKPAAAKKPAAKKPPAEKKPAAEKKPPAEKKAAAEKKPDGEKAAPAKKAASKPVAKKASAKKTSEPVAAKEQADAEEPKQPEKKPARAAAQKGAAPPRRRVVRAHARYVRTSARKARMVCGHLRGKTVGEARAILAFTPREVARDWSKLLESAVANAESNHELLEDDLIIREAYADEGPTIKRFRPRAMGRASPIRKRTSHLTITLTPGS
jgi:ribosomal protein L22